MLRSARGWKTVCALINMTALHPEASQTSFEAFALVCKDDKLLTSSNFAPLLETALVFVDRHAKVNSPSMVEKRKRKKREDFTLCCYFDEKPGDMPGCQIIYCALCSLSHD